MKILTLTVPVSVEDKIRAELEQEKGISIFREREIWTPISGLGKQVTHIMFLIWLVDPEAHTLLKLKYPYTFEDVSA